MPRTKSSDVTRPSNTDSQGPINSIENAIAEIYNSSEMLNHDIKTLFLHYLEQVDRLITVVEQNHRNALHVLNHVRHGVLQALEENN
jgi:hypothetical protein